MFRSIILKDLFILTIALFLIGFSGYKSATASFTHDESYSYLHYVHQSFLDIVSYKTPFTNNHVLNSLGMKYSEKLFGSSELAMRMPNLLALVIYLLFAYRLFKEACPSLLIPAFIILSLNPYLLDFFGLARGYGLSIGFMMMSLYFLNRYFQTLKVRDVVWFNVGAFFSVLGNFALINYYLAALIVFNVLIILKKAWLQPREEGFSKSLFQYNTINVISLLITVGVIYEPFRKIIVNKIVNFGGQTGFIADTVESLLVRFFYLAPLKPGTWGVAPIDSTLLILLKTSVVLVPGITVSLLVFHLLKKNRAFFENARPLIISNLVLLLITLATILQFYLFDTPYLKERFALFLVPLFLLNLIFLLDKLSEWAEGQLAGTALIYLTAALFILNTSRHLNATYYLDWKYDLSTKAVIETLISEKASGQYDSIHLGSHWLFSPALNFYRVTLNLDWLTEVYQHGGLGQYDHFFYEFEEDLGKQEQDLSGKEIILSAEEIGTLLLRIKPGG
jgi:hypothetical protein